LKREFKRTGSDKDWFWRVPWDVPIISIPTIVHILYGRPETSTEKQIEDKIIIMNVIVPGFHNVKTIDGCVTNGVLKKQIVI